MDGAGGEERAASGINGAGGQAAGRPRTGPAQLGHYTPSSSRPHVAATGAQEGNPSTEEEAIASAIVLQGITAVGLPGAVLLEHAAKGLWNGVIREVHHASMRNSAEMPSAVGVDEAAEAEAAIEPWTLRYRDPELEHVYLATKWRFHVGALRFIAVVSFIIATMYFTIQLSSFASIDLAIHLTVLALHVVTIAGVFTYPRESQWEPWFEYVIAVSSLILALDAFAYAMRRPHHDVRNAVYMLIPPFLTPTLFGMPFRTNSLTYMVQCLALLACGTALLPPFEIVASFVVAEATAYFLERNHKISFYIVDLRGRKERSTRVKLLLAQLAHSRVQRDIELRNQYLSFLCHEVRNPANGILGNAQLLQDTQLSAEQRDLMNDLIASVEQMGNVLNNVLDLNKLEAGKLELDTLPCKLNRVASAVSSQFRRTALDRGIVLRVEVDEALAASALDYPFYTDTYRLLQCCSNLMSNACKFTQAGSVTLRIVLVDVVLGNKGAAGHTGASPAVGGLRKRCCGTGGSGYGATSDPATEQGCPSVCQEGEEDVASRLSAAMDQAEGGGGASGVEGDEGQAAREWGHARTAFAPYCVVRFEVRDTGPGLSKADQRKLFVSYSQCHASVARAHGGTGLGLTIVKELARLTGGHVGVRSRLGCGSAFFFTTRLYLRKPSAQVLEALQREATDAAREEAHRVESSQSNWRVDDVLERVRKGSLELGDDMSSLADVVDGRGDHSPPRGSASPQTQGSEPSEPRRSGEPLHQSAASARRRAPSASAAPTRPTSASSATSAVSSSDERLTFPPRSNSPVSSLESGAREVQSLPETVLPCPRRVVEVYDSQLAQQRHAQNASGAAARSPSGESPLCTLLSGDVARPQSTRSGEEDGQSLGAASFGTAEPRLLSFTGEVGGNSTPSSPGDGAAGGPGWSGEDGLSSSSSSNTSFYTVVQSRSGKQDTESPGGSPVVTLTARSRSAQRVAQTPPPTNAPDPDSSDEIVLTSTHGTRPAQCGAAPALFRGRRHTTSSATSRAMPQPCLFPSPPARDASPLADGVMPFGAGIQGGETGVGAGLQLPNLVSTPSMASVVASLPVLPTGVAMPASASSGVSVLPPAPRTPSQPVEGTSPLPAPAQSPALPLAPPMGPVTGFARPRAATHRLCQWRRPPHGTWVREVCPESGITSPARQAGATLRALPGLSASVLVVGPEAGKASWALRLGHECGAAGSAGPPPPSGVPLRDAVAQAVAAARGSGAGREGAPSPSSASAAAQRSPHARARGVGALLGAAHCTLTRVAVVDVPWLDGPGATQIGLADCGAGEGWAGSFASHALRKSDIVVLLATVPDEAGRPVEAALHASQRLALALVRACSESSRRASLPLPPLVMGVLAPAGATKLLVTGSGRELNPLWDVTTLETSCADAGAAALVRSISSDPGEIQSTVEDFGRVMDQLVSIWCNALCVDDSVINARLLHRHAISCFGVSPTVASNGEEAIAAAHSKLDAHGPFRLVFMDIDLGAGINGREAAARIRQLPHPSSLTARREATRAPRFSAHSIIVAVTGNATKQEQDACKKEMDDFLAKPVPVARFRDILRASFTGPAPAAPRSPQERS